MDGSKSLAASTTDKNGKPIPVKAFNQSRTSSQEHSCAPVFKGHSLDKGQRAISIRSAIEVIAASERRLMHDNPFVFLCTICQRITEPLELNAICDRIRRRKSIINFSLRQYSIKTCIDQKDINIFRRVLEVTYVLLIVKQRTCGRRFIIKLTGHKQELILDRIPERLDRLI